MTTATSSSMAWLGDSLGVSTSLSESDVARLHAESEQLASNRAHAVRTVAGYSVNAEECRELLEMLGLGSDDLQAAAHLARVKKAPKRTTSAKSSKPRSAKKATSAKKVTKTQTASRRQSAA